MENQFEYGKALERLEQIARTVENPETGIDSIDSCIKEAESLLEACRKYLRSARDTVDAFEQ